MFTKDQSGPNEVQDIIRNELLFLLEPDERQFSRQLLAHLLDEGCNLPLVLARPRFYELMVNGILATLPAGKQKALLEKFGEPPQHFARHEEFFAIMQFCRTSLDVSPKQMALEVTKSIETLTQEWRLDEILFQQDVITFESRLQAIMLQLAQNLQASPQTNEQTNPQASSNQSVSGDPVSLSQVRRRLYIAMTTSLVRYLKDGASFQAMFGTIPEAIHAMRKNHEAFSRFMRLCQEQIPYFTHIASQTFWRTLETLRLENRNM